MGVKLVLCSVDGCRNRTQDCCDSNRSVRCPPQKCDTGFFFWGGGGGGEGGMRPRSLPEVSAGRIPVHDRDPEIHGIVHVDRPPVRRYRDPVAPVK